MREKCYSVALNPGQTPHNFTLMTSQGPDTDTIRMAQTNPSARRTTLSMYISVFLKLHHIWGNSSEGERTLVKKTCYAFYSATS